MKKHFKSLFALFLLAPALVVASCELPGSNSSSVVVHNHDFGTLVEKVDANCTVDGHQAYYYCAGCQKYFDSSKNETTLDALTIKATGHKVLTDSGKDATCTEAGKTEGKHCSVCGEVIEPQNTIDPLGHKYGDVVITKNPTLTEDGEGEKVCANDNTHKDSVVVPKLSDNAWIKTTKVVANCQTDGVDNYTSIYGSLDVNTGKGDHSYTWEVDQGATVTTTGIKHEECSVCHAKRNEGTVIPLQTCTHGNVTKTDEVSATCVAQGKKAYYTCSDCTKHYEDEACQIEIEDLATYGIINIDANAHGHITKTDAVEANCTTAGKDEYYQCDSCQKYYKEEACTNLIADISTYGVRQVVADAHNYGDWTAVAENEPADDTAGKLTRTCSNNSEHVETVDVNKLTDTDFWTIGDIVNATCETIKYRQYTSKDEKIVYTRKLGNALGHKEVYDYYQEGEKWYKKTTCSREGCNHEEINEIEVSTVSEFVNAADTENAKYVIGYVVTAQAKASAASMEFHISDGTNTFYVAKSLAVEIGDEVIISCTYANTDGKISVSGENVKLCKVMSSGNDYVAKSGTVNEKTVESFITEHAAILADDTKTVADYYSTYGNKYYELTGYIIQDPSITTYASYVFSSASDGAAVLWLAANGDYDLSIYKTKEVVVRAFLNDVTIDRTNTVVKAYYRVQDIDLVGHPTYSISIDENITNGTIAPTNAEQLLTGIKYGSKVGLTSKGSINDTDTYVLKTLTVNGVADEDAAGNEYAFEVKVLENVAIVATYKVFSIYDDVKVTALVSSIAETNGWTDNSVQHQELFNNGVLSISAAINGTNDGKVYDSNNWRLYGSGGLVLTLTNTTELTYTIKGFTVSYASGGAITGAASDTYVDLSSTIQDTVTYKVTATTKVSKVVVVYRLLNEDESKLLNAYNNFDGFAGFAESYNSAQNIALPQTYTKDDVNYNLSWTVTEGSTFASVSGTNLVIPNPSDNGTVKVKLTITSPGSNSLDKEYSFEIEGLKTNSITIDFTSSTNAYSIATSVTKDAVNTATAEGVSIAYVNANYYSSSKYLFMGSKTNKTPAYIYNTSAIAGTIVSVKVVTTDGASGSARYNIGFSKSAAVTTSVSATDYSLLGKGTYEAKPSKDAGYVYFNVSCVTTGYNGQIAKIVITYLPPEE